MGRVDTGLGDIHKQVAANMQAPQAARHVARVEGAGQVVHHGVPLVRRHLAAGQLLHWVPLGRCWLVIPLIDQYCARLQA